MSHVGIEVTRFIAANERQIDEGRRTKPAEEIAVDDLLRMPGRELHDDLAGLTFEIPVEAIERGENRLIVFDDRGQRICFSEGEQVRLERSTPAE